MRVAGRFTQERDDMLHLISVKKIYAKITKSGDLIKTKMGTRFTRFL